MVGMFGQKTMGLLGSAKIPSGWVKFRHELGIDSIGSSLCTISCRCRRLGVQGPAGALTLCRQLLDFLIGVTAISGLPPAACRTHGVSNNGAHDV